MWGQQEFTYRFNEYNEDDVERAYPYFTNRLVTPFPGECFKYDALQRITLATDLDRYKSAAKYAFANSTYASNIAIPMSSEGATATIYVYRGLELPQLTKINNYGNRCLWVWVHQISLLG